MVLHCPPVQIIIRADRGKNSSLTSQVAECSLTAHSENCSSNIPSVKSGLQLCPSTIDTSNSKDNNKNLLTFDLVWFYWNFIRKFFKEWLRHCICAFAPLLFEGRLPRTPHPSFPSLVWSFKSIFYIVWIYQILPSFDACNLDWKLDSDPSTHHTQVLTLRILVHFQVDRQVDTSKDRHALLKVEFNFTHILCFPNSSLSVPKRKTAVQNFFLTVNISKPNFDVEFHAQVAVVGWDVFFVLVLKMGGGGRKKKALYLTCVTLYKHTIWLSYNNGF